jgi:hypothetical protein
MDRDIKRFLDRFEEVCRKVGGEVVKESTGVSEESLSKAGLSEWDLTKCIFKEKTAATINVLDRGEATIARKLLLEICVKGWCADLEDFDKVSVGPRPTGSIRADVVYAGDNTTLGPVTKLFYWFHPEDELKEISIEVEVTRGRKRRIYVYVDSKRH